MSVFVGLISGGTGNSLDLDLDILSCSFDFRWNRKLRVELDTTANRAEKSSAQNIGMDPMMVGVSIESHLLKHFF